MVGYIGSLFNCEDNAKEFPQIYMWLDIYLLGVTTEYKFTNNITVILYSTCRPSY